MDSKLLISLLKAEVLPTMGCTEPGAVALAAAYASELLEGKINRIDIIVNSNIYKNGMAVGIPGTGETGLEIAAALGAIKKHPQQQLAVLAGVSKEELTRAKAMLMSDMIRVSIDETKNNLWVEVRIEAGSDWSHVIIKDKHTHVVSIQKNGTYILNKQHSSTPQQIDNRFVLRGTDVTIRDIIRTVELIPSHEIEFLLEGITMNLLAAELGIAKKLGMGIGAAFAKMVHEGMLSDDIINFAKTLTAAATDARMSGENVEIMSSAGSGNHGITAILPVYAVAKTIGTSQEKLLRAVAMSHLITIYIKIQTGNLSALCGCAVAAATGASAAITWMMCGDVVSVESAMKNVIANLTGMICDGGKVGCALKLSTAAAVAVESSLLAQRNVVVPITNGIIANTVEGTVRNLGKVSNPGMLHTDKVIMEVMLGKGEQRIVS